MLHLNHHIVFFVFTYQNYSDVSEHQFVL